MRLPAILGGRAGAHGLLPFCLITALFVLFGVELLTLATVPSFGLVYVYGLLAVSLGTLHGLLWELLLAVTVRLPARARLLLWLAIALGLAALQSHALNAFGRLTGRYAIKAIAVLCLSLGGNALIALIAYGMHRDASGFLYNAPRRTRWFAALLLCALAGGLFWADLAAYAGLYPEAHFGLKLGAWCLLAFALALPLRALDRPWPWPLFAGLIALGVLPQFQRPQGMTFETLFTRTWTGFVVQLARDATDVDLDGYSSLYDGGDCQPWNHRVNPGAREIPRNKIDDNCFLGDAVDKAKEGGWPAPAENESPLDVVLITIDALRPDHLGVYNPTFYGEGARATSPKLDAFAQKAIVFVNAYSTGGGTSIALGTMLRGVYARRLHWTPYYESDHFQLYRAGQELPKGETVASMFPLAFGDPHPTLPELLKRRGMYTAAVLDDGFSEMLTPGTGIERGFVTFQEGDLLGKADDKAVVDFAIETLNAAPRDRRVFLWAHLFGTHAPNTPHAGAKVYGPSLIDGYDHEINYLDAQLGRLIRAIDRWPRPIAVIIAADHGEVLRNGRYHGYTLHDDVVRIPLLVRVPGWTPQQVQTPASLIDVLPTVLALTATPAPQGLDGLPLSAVIAGERAARHRILIADTWVYGVKDPRVDFTAAVNGLAKLTLDRLTQGTTLDPRTLARPRAKTRAALEKAMRRYLEETGGAIDLGK